MNTVLTAIGGTIASLLPGDKQNGLAHERTVLSVIGRTVTDPFSRTGVFDRLIDLVSELIKSDRIAITVLDPDRDTFRLVHLRGIEVWDVEPGEGIPLKNSFVAEVVRFDRPMRFNASDQCPQKIGFEMAGLHCRIGTPLRSNDQVIGTLHLSSKEPNAYSERDLSRLEQIGQQISGTVASEFLLKSEQTRTRQLKGMYQVAAILANDQSFKKKAQGIVDTLAQISMADLAVLRRRDRGFDQLDLVAFAGPATKDHNSSLLL